MESVEAELDPFYIHTARPCEDDFAIPPGGRFHHILSRKHSVSPKFKSPRNGLPHTYVPRPPEMMRAAGAFAAPSSSIPLPLLYSVINVDREVGDICAVNRPLGESAGLRHQVSCGKIWRVRCFCHLCPASICTSSGDETPITCNPVVWRKSQGWVEVICKIWLETREISVQSSHDIRCSSTAWQQGALCGKHAILAAHDEIIKSHCPQPEARNNENGRNDG